MAMWILILSCDNTVNALTKPRSGVSVSHVIVLLGVSLTHVPCDCSPGCLSDTVHTLNPSLTLLDALAGPRTSPACICFCTSLPWIPCTCFSHCLELLPIDSPRLTPQFTPFFPSESSTWNVTHITSSFFVFYHSIYGDPVSCYVLIIY